MIRLVDAGTITAEERHEIERLVDAFNRYPPRAVFFLWGLMSIRSNDYDLWDKKFFVDFYVDTKKSKSKTVGISQKVVACYLQQGFAKEEMIPIDTWIDTFHRFALGIKDQKDFFGAFSEMGKLERVIWSVAQAKKTNNTTFFDMLWCIRYGDTGNNEYRGANPLSCFECKLQAKCPSYKMIRDKMVLVKDGAGMQLADVMGKKNAKGKKIADASVTSEAENNNCSFICLTENKVPKKIFVKKGTKKKPYWKMTDEFSGYILKGQKYVTRYVDKIVTIDSLVRDLGTFVPEMDDMYQAEDE